MLATMTLACVKVTAVPEYQDTYVSVQTKTASLTLQLELTYMCHYIV
jgi:hypothetical protein